MVYIDDFHFEISFDGLRVRVVIFMYAYYTYKYSCIVIGEYEIHFMRARGCKRKGEAKKGIPFHKRIVPQGVGHCPTTMRVAGNVL